MIFFYNIFFISFLWGSNIIRKILTNRKKTLSSKRILEVNFSKNEAFSFIQVGANDGISFDFLHEFVIARKSNGIVIEPIKEYFYELNLNYKDFPDIIKINKAVHPSKKEITMNRISLDSINQYPVWAKGIASIDPDHHKKLGIDSKDVIEVRVSADNLMNIIDTNFRNKNLNYFQVDTEGFDYEIINMIDFKVIKPDIIKYESVHLKQTEQIDLQKMLTKMEYFLFSENGDTVCVNIKKIMLTK